jgi:hypothetical protein
VLLARAEDLRAVDRADQIFAEVRPVDLEEVFEQLAIAGSRLQTRAYAEIIWGAAVAGRE